MRRRSLFVLILLAMVALGLSLAAQEKATGKSKATKVAAQGAKAAKGDVAAGRKEFDAKCVTCHGKDGSGNTPMGKSMKVADLRSDTVQKMSDEELFAAVAKGKGKMTGYEKQLGAAKVHDLVAYVRSLKK